MHFNKAKGNAKIRLDLLSLICEGKELIINDIKNVFQ